MKVIMNDGRSARIDLIVNPLPAYGSANRCGAVADCPTVALRSASEKTSNMMEQTEGPPNQPSLDQLGKLKKIMADADATYEKDIKEAMEAFEKASK